MSVNAMAWAKRQTCGNATLKAVLLAVADYADEDGKAWPSQTRLAADTELDKRTVRRALQSLEEKGFLRREEYTREDNSRGADRIFLALTPKDRKSGGRDSVSGGEGTVSGGVGAHSPGGEGTVSALTTFEPPIEPPEEPSLGRADARAANVIPLPIEKPKPEKRAHRMPSDFTLTPERLAYALKEGFSHAAAEREFAKFVTHHGAKGTRFVNWDLAWQTWVRNAVDRFGATRGAAPSGHGSSAPSLLRAYQRAASRFSNPGVLPE